VVVAGLGNPGPRYARNRHNIGFMVVEEAAVRWGATPWKEVSPAALVCTAQLDGWGVTLVKPLTYMNLSGKAVRQVLDQSGVGPANLVVAHDDLDLEEGRLKIAVSRGHGGHNGVRSIMTELEARDFFRLKLGIGRPPEGVGVADYVLEDFSDRQSEGVSALVDRAVSALRALITEGPERAMNQFHPHV